MNCNISIKKFLPLTVAIILMAASTAQAEVSLSWSPADTAHVAPGGTGRLSIHLDEAINIRTVEVTVTYDTLVVTSLGGGSGALYTDSGYFVFDGFEEEPGSWHGYAIIMGAGEYLTGPGALLFWDFEGLADGTSPVVTVEALLYDEASPPNLIPDVMLDNATIIVHDPLTSVQDVPDFSGMGNRLMVAPNPFNPRTRISFDVPREMQARLSVFDMRGRQIAVLHDGPIPAGTLARDWNGTDDQGRSQPGGVYLFRLETPEGTAWAKGNLVK